MANSWFQFKQFRVEQDRSALKVGTDACILGAWASHPQPTRILDIGTGTGLLALMLAQRFNAPVDALEPEARAAEQASENFANSPWAKKLHLIPTTVQVHQSPQLYSLIVCNPPFYPNHLKTTDDARNQALHQDTLNFKELSHACKSLLAADGICHILLPPRQAEEFAVEAHKIGLYLYQKLIVQERSTSPIHRTVYSYRHQPTANFAEELLCIRASDGQYSADYQALLKDFYLAF